MKHKKYKEIKEGKEVRKVTITEEQAKRFNKSSKETGISYQLVKGEAKAEPKKELKQGEAKAEPKN